MLATSSARSIAIATEILVGLIIGYGASLPLIAMQVGGQMMGHQLGLHLAQVFNPERDIRRDRRAKPCHGTDQRAFRQPFKQRQRQMTNRGVDFGRHDYAAMGRAFGGHGHRVSNRQELQAALEAAQSADRFTVIAAEIHKEAYDGRI